MKLADQNIDQELDKQIKIKNKLGLSCAKLRASLFFTGLDYILVYFD